MFNIQMKLIVLFTLIGQLTLGSEEPKSSGAVDKQRNWSDLKWRQEVTVENNLWTVKLEAPYIKNADEVHVSVYQVGEGKGRNLIQVKKSKVTKSTWCDALVIQFFGKEFQGESREIEVEVTYPNGRMDTSPILDLRNTWWLVWVIVGGVASVIIAVILMVCCCCCCRSKRITTIGHGGYGI